MRVIVEKKTCQIMVLIKRSNMVMMMINFDDEDIDQDEKTMRKMAITSQLAVLDRSLRSTIGKKLLVQLSLYYISLSYQPLVINIALYTNISLGKHFSSESRTFSLV